MAVLMPIHDDQSTSPRYTLVVCTAAALFSLLLLSHGRPWYCRASSRNHLAGRWAQSSHGPGRQLHFLRYQPSSFEQEWFARRQEFRDDPPKICQQIQNDADKIERWLAVSKLTNKGDHDTLIGTALTSTGIFSTLVYQVDGSDMEVTVAVEPLAAHWRHPYAVVDCSPKDAVHVENRDHILLSGMTTSLFSYIYPGRRYLFDLGTAGFPTSLGWLLEAYGKLGIAFDSIWAWELQPLSGARYWKEVPDNVKPLLHFYNTGVEFNPSSANHVINIIKSVYQPGDFITVKLDIDSPVNEAELIQHVIKDDSLLAMISEMFYELHYHATHMERYGWDFNATYSEAAEELRRLRHAGIHLHYWP